MLQSNECYRAGQAGGISAAPSCTGNCSISSVFLLKGDEAKRTQSRSGRIGFAWRLPGVQ